MMIFKNYASRLLIFQNSGLKDSVRVFFSNRVGIVFWGSFWVRNPLLSTTSVSPSASVSASVNAS